ncbi:hypothetical protein LTR10_021664 [Elasticomyces elasticus]|uniref:DUF924 domain-containing protein n=1 Tax=Exophiala sideris TaxID=1016849 RepID=A0ABR0J936_9EURO|nr:hypothetical protein LTR10_021664 [Elasticomyces elasticus]KAK5022190.1 hypothetical protein LTS07_010269 [Exophiala sideris]KAK5037368.1 hypothetical protein LTR13_004525 [Exophiala sideris]KAK5059032.1 hypothetical protein LTR69_006320 [Exophiala sideris]KAK5182864.1 hypothetical protein LTR44_004573 [Eurotiomycetes sp. CCFEE 6388]
MLCVLQLIDGKIERLKKRMYALLFKGKKVIVLQVQSALQGSLQSFTSPFWSGNATSMSTSTMPTLSPSATQDINRTLSFWFDGPTQNWFAPPNPSEFDASIRDTFGELITQARTDELDTWADDPRGALALVILLDQFPRNIYRGSGEAHASDAKACELATRSIAREFDRKVGELEAMFFYLPLMHDETLVSQIACVALYEALLARCHPDSEAAKLVPRSLSFAKGHRDAILEFGRFPSRNKILERESTPEEIKFLEEHPSGFY